jgi:hypothetical protein
LPGNGAKASKDVGVLAPAATTFPGSLDRPVLVRFVFFAYVALIAAGLVVYIAVGIANPG